MLFSFTTESDFAFDFFDGNRTHTRLLKMQLPYHWTTKLFHSGRADSWLHQLLTDSLPPDPLLRFVR